MAPLPLQLKRTANTGVVPTANLFVGAGSLIINTKDGILFSTDGNTSVFPIGANNVNVNVSNTITANNGNFKFVTANSSVGTAGQVLTSGGAGSNVYWATPANSSSNGVLTTVISYLTSLLSNQTVDSWSSLLYRGAFYYIEVSDNINNIHQLENINVVHNGTTPTLVEYGIISTTPNTYVATFDANILLGSFYLTVTPTSANTTVKISRTLVAI